MGAEVLGDASMVMENVVPHGATKFVVKVRGRRATIALWTFGCWRRYSPARSAL